MAQKKQTAKRFRKAKDSMGEMQIPSDKLYGASTQRAVLNFPISSRTFGRPFIHALGALKLACAKANQSLGNLKSSEAKAISAAAKQVANGSLDEHFVVDIFQTGSGTSTNMNANEVIAFVANKKLGSKKPAIHPNDHVNMGQSSNDTIPTAIHIAAYLEIKERLLGELKLLAASLKKKSTAFKKVYKIGRTHLQDATPMTLGQEFGGYAAQIEDAERRIRERSKDLLELAIGGTAVGTGINTHPRFARLVCRYLKEDTGVTFKEAKNHFAHQGAKDACVAVSGELKALAVAANKIANDIRWLGCGPRAGFAEIQLPAVQPGSSIMPGKVNPVMAEAVLQVCAQVIGNDAAVTFAGSAGNFELNVMMPVIARNLLESIEILSNSLSVFRTRCIDGITADKENCKSQIEKSLMLSTPLVPVIGYDKAAAVAKEAYTRGMTIRQVILEKGLIEEVKLNKILDVAKLV